MKEIEVSFTIRIALEGTDVRWVEEELLRVRQEVFKRVIEEIEGQELKRERYCERCGSMLVKNGRDRKEIKTLVGKVKIDRVRLRCQRWKQDIYPLDQLLGLASGERVTMGVRERSLWAALNGAGGEDGEYSGSSEV